MTDTTAAPKLSASARLVARALAETHETTVVALTAATGVSKSTVAKALTLLERAGVAQRTVHETDDGAREADLWSPEPGLGGLLFAAAVDTGYGHAEKLLNTSGRCEPPVTPSLADGPDRTGEGKGEEVSDAILPTDIDVMPDEEGAVLKADGAGGGDSPVTRSDASASATQAPAADTPPLLEAAPRNGWLLAALPRWSPPRWRRTRTSSTPRLS